MTNPVQLKDLNPGDTVDVVLKGLKVDWIDSSGDFWFLVDEGKTFIPRDWLTDATIARHDPPIEKGDVVRRHGEGVAYDVFAVRGQLAWISDAEDPIWPVDKLTLISKGPAQ